MCGDDSSLFLSDNQVFEVFFSPLQGASALSRRVLNIPENFTAKKLHLFLPPSINHITK
jgi:hypothetical protein